MSPKLRAKFASSLNNIERPEDWQWNRWLKPPTSESKSLSFPKIIIINKKSFATRIDIPGNDGFFIDTIETPVNDSDKFFKQLKIHSTKPYKILIPLQKSVRMFFNIMQSKASKNFFKSKLELNKPTLLIEKQFQLPIIKSIKASEPLPVVKNLFSEKQESIDRITIISENLFPENLFLVQSLDISQINLEPIIKFVVVTDSLIPNVKSIIVSDSIVPVEKSISITDSLITHDKNVPIREFDFGYNIYLSNYPFDLTNNTSTDNLLAEDSDTKFIKDTYLSEYFLNSNDVAVTWNLLSYQYLTKFIDEKYIGKYFLYAVPATGNLLPTSCNIELLDNKYLIKYYLTHIDISDDLLSFIPDCFDITLLDPNTFDIKLLDIKNLDTELLPGVNQILDEYKLRIINNKESKISEVQIEKFSTGKKHITSIQVPSVNYGEVTKNLCHRQLLYKIPKIDYTSNAEITPAYVESAEITPAFTFHNSLLHNFDVNEFSALLPLSEIDINKQLNSFLSLYEYQKQGVEFLINNSFAILVDDPGLGKSIQSISALRILFKIGLIRSVLILCTEQEYGSSDLSMLSGKSNGWEGHFYHWAPELTVKVIRGDEGQRRIDWYDYAQVFIVSLKTLSNDIRKKIIHYDRLSIFSCLILDDFRSIKADFLENKKVFDSLNLNYLWILNDFPFDYHLDEMICKIKPMVDDRPTMELGKYYDIKPEIPSTFLRRQKNEVLNFLPQKNCIDKWVELHPEQKAEYDHTLNAGVQKITDSMNSGNILIIQPQIFNLLHQLMQICNYPSKMNNSGKEDLLLMQLDTILQNREKVIILSQYEKQGIKKLEELLTKEKIGFVTHQNGISETVLIKNIKDFNSRDNINVFLIDSKVLKGVMNLGSVTNIIHFDHWWSPMSAWQAEDRIITGNNKKNVNIYTYWTLNTIEESIYQILGKKGLFNKGIVESFSSIFLSEMITTDEWLQIMGIPVENAQVSDQYANSAFERLNTIPDETFKEIGKSFLTKLGYSSSKFMTYVDSSGKDIELTSKVVNNREETIIVKLVHAPAVDADMVNDFVTTISNYKNISKCFFITSGFFTREARQFTTYKNDKLNLIDGMALANYLIHYNLI